MSNLGISPDTLHSSMNYFQYLVAGTTAWSGLSYAYLKNAVTILGTNEELKAKQGARGRAIIGVLYGSMVFAATWLFFMPKASAEGLPVGISADGNRDDSESEIDYSSDEENDDMHQEGQIPARSMSRSQLMDYRMRLLREEEQSRRRWLLARQDMPTAEDFRTSRRALAREMQEQSDSEQETRRHVTPGGRTALRRPISVCVSCVCLRASEADAAPMLDQRDATNLSDYQSQLRENQRLQLENSPPSTRSAYPHEDREAVERRRRIEEDARRRYDERTLLSIIRFEDGLSDIQPHCSLADLDFLREEAERDPSARARRIREGAMLEAAASELEAATGELESAACELEAAVCELDAATSELEAAEAAIREQTERREARNMPNGQVPVRTDATQPRPGIHPLWRIRIQLLELEQQNERRVRRPNHQVTILVLEEFDKGLTLVRQGHYMSWEDYQVALTQLVDQTEKRLKLAKQGHSWECLRHVGPNSEDGRPDCECEVTTA